MCDKINEEFWKCIKEHQYSNIQKCKIIQLKEIECIKKIDK